MTDERARLTAEIRYAERLCLRTARFYRHVQVAGVFVTVLAGSAALSKVSGWLSADLTAAAAVVLAGFGAALLAVRPGDKAGQNESDAKRYAQLRTASAGMDDIEMARALDKARESDVPEIELLRDVAWNDVVREMGRADVVVRLSVLQRVAAWLA